MTRPSASRSGLPTPRPVSAREAVSETSDSTVDNLLLRAGLSAEQISEARRSSDGDLAASIEKVSGLSQARFAALLAERAGLPFVADIDDDALQPQVLEPLTIGYCRRNRILPINANADRVSVATSDPLAPGPFDDLRALYGLDIDPIVVPAPALAQGIDRAFDRAATLSVDVIDEIAEADAFILDAGALEVPDLLEADDEAPIIRLVNSLLFKAAKDRASDIHIEPYERNSSVRMRIDGMLVEMLAPDRRIHAAMVSRIKVMAGMDIAEKRLPQDGGIRARVATRELDVRVSTIPTTFGERVVMRLLDRSATLLGLAELGFAGDSLTALRRMIRQSHGILLVTGPTGSGKTTTLYAALSEINSPEKNIITIEDPVEYQLRGIGQIQVNPKIDLDFAGGLRSVLRQDPDVIMVGEIRDTETARIAIQAAMTGHLVMSTLHTNDAFSAVTRLLDMDVEPFLVSSSVAGIVAQRLVRRLCPSCSQPTTAEESGLAELGVGYLLGDNSGLKRAGDGCDGCRGTGYHGRTSIHEILPIDDTIRPYIMERADARTLEELSVARGMPTMRAEGAAKARSGLTSVAEVLRVTTEDAG